MRILKAAAVYFGVVFGAGFALGPIRITWLVPRLGERVAELLEAPVMFVVIVLAARWVARRFVTPRTRGRLLMTGLVALGLLLSCEFTFVLWLTGLTLRQYFESRDPVSGGAYAILLVLFALMPLLVSRGGDRSAAPADPGPPAR